MPKVEYHFTGPDGTNHADQLLNFARQIGLERAAPGRYSMLLVLHLWGGFASRRLNPGKIVDEILALEGRGRGSLTKAPIQNKYPPLKGLWHKHYLPDGMRSFAMNIRRGLAKYGLPLFEERAREAQESGEERFLTEEDVNALSYDATIGNWERLAGEKAVTGEWIMYARHDGENYYLCLGSHDKSQHEHLRQQIDVVCCLEFPFLEALLATG